MPSLPAIPLSPNHDQADFVNTLIGAHWRRDVEVMLRRRDWFFERIEEFSEDDGAALLWCLPWDGERSLELRQLDPWFIEVCRRVRLYADCQGRITAKSVGSKSARIAAKDLRGNVSDPWIPINHEKDFAAYNSQPSYQVVSEVLFDKKKWLRPLLLEWHDGIDKLPMWARFDVTVRGQGTTKGQHLREVPIDSQRRRAFLFDSVERDKIAQIAAGMVKDAGTLKSPILKTALLTLVKGGVTNVRLDDRTADWIEQWLTSADKRIEEIFFERLFQCRETGHDQLWGVFLRRVASEIFEAAARTVPVAGVRRLNSVLTKSA
ncbi:MAG: hypothetical protein H6852_06365 [Geminicoccaceae bacterium]|nr:hypothetical protein [Geminicoccaceae bacterium]